MPHLIGPALKHLSQCSDYLVTLLLCELLCDTLNLGSDLEDRVTDFEEEVWVVSRVKGDFPSPDWRLMKSNGTTGNEKLKLFLVVFLPKLCSNFSSPIKRQAVLYDVIHSSILILTLWPWEKYILVFFKLFWIWSIKIWNLEFIFNTFMVILQYSQVFYP